MPIAWETKKSFFTVFSAIYLKDIAKLTGSVTSVYRLAAPAPAPAPAPAHHWLPPLAQYPVQKPASAARVAHAFPYSFASFRFDLSFIPFVKPETTSLLFKEFARMRSTLKYVQYPDEHYIAGKDAIYCLENRPAPCIKNHELPVDLTTLDWFFQSLTTLFPDVMVLSPWLIHWNLQFLSVEHDAEWYSSFLRNVKDRRPRFVMHPFNLPKHLDRQRHAETNPDSHYVLTCIEFDWSQPAVSSKISVLDPFHAAQYIDPAIKFYQTGGYFASFNPVFEDADIEPIQLGSKNNHCGVYVLALALNTVFGTLSSMGKRLNPQPKLNDTKPVGQLLRTCVAWDCTQYPSLLDTCLLMSPKFSPISSRIDAVSASAWWVKTPYHNIADSLAIKYGSIFIPVSLKGFSEQDRMSSVAPNRKKLDKITADGPFFFKNENLFVKVNCIGLIGHRLTGHHTAAKRAASALHEASATQYYCETRKWFCETFGLICVGLVCPCAFVCIVRTLGTAVKDINVSDVGKIFHESSSLPLPSQTQLSPIHGRAFHGDPHGGNMVLVTVKTETEMETEVQLVDFDRLCLISGECPPLFLFTWYATTIAGQCKNAFHTRALMRIIKRSGLDATRAYFSAFYENDTFLQHEFNSELFVKSPATLWKYVPLLDLFERLDGANLKPELIADNTIKCGLGNITIHTPINVENSIVVSWDKLSDVKLSCESDTKSFFDRVSNPSDHQIVVFVNGSDLSGCSDEESEQPTLQNPEHPKRKRGRHNDVSGQSKDEFAKVALPAHFYLIDKMIAIGNIHVLESIQKSMMRRFGTHGELKGLILPEVPKPENVLRQEHFGCDTVLVVDNETRSRCTAFITSQTFLSLDTETTCPRFDEDRISLIQIGTSSQVFIIQVALQPQPFFTALEEAIGQKTLLTWGPEKTALQKVVRCDSCTFVDVQEKHLKFAAKKGQLPSLAECITNMFGGRYILNKSWTCSGWDNDELTQGQLNYATLDVVCPYVLYANSEKHHVCFQNSDQNSKYITFFEHNLTTRVTKQRGFSSTANFLGHNAIHGVPTASRGFVMGWNSTGKRKQIYAKGFQTSQGEERVPSESVNLDRFFSLLEQNKLCCALCSACFEHYQTWSSFRYENYAYYLRRPDRSCETKRFDPVANDSDEQRALFCAIALADCFLMIPPQSDYKGVLTLLVKAVRSDIFYGYIHETLALLTLRNFGHGPVI